MNASRASVSIEEFSSTLTYIELILIASIMIIICVITIIGNALVMISFILDKKLRTLTNYFLLSLAVSDIMIATFSMPLYITYLLVGEWTLGPAVCDMWLSQDYTCSNASGLNLLMIGFDRYFSVTNPLKYRAKKTGKRVGIMIASVWIIAFLLWPPWIYAWPYIEGRRTVPEHDCYIQFLETNSYVTIVTSILDYYIPVTIMCVLYYKIWRETRRRTEFLANMDVAYQTESMCLQRKLSSDAGKSSFPLKISFGHVSNCNNNKKYSKPDYEGNKNAESSVTNPAANKEEATEESVVRSGEFESETCKDIIGQRPSNFITNRNTSPSSDDDGECKSISSIRKAHYKHDSKAARVLTTILLAFILTTTPYNVLVIVKNLDTTHSVVPDSLWNFVCYLFYINSTLNPMCYALANENFRKTYWKILTCSWSQRSRYRVNNYSNNSAQSGKSCSTNLQTSFL